MKKIIISMFLILINIFGESDTERYSIRKTIIGISPLLIITTSGNDNGDVPIIGSFYYGNSKGNKEVLYGMGINTLTGVEFNVQNRKYYKENATGFFGGTLLAAGAYTLKTYIDKENSKVYVSSYEGENYYAWGLRVGSNIGYRFTLGGNNYLTTKFGLSYPLYKISENLKYIEEEKNELKRINAIYKMLDFGVHLEFTF